MSETAGALKALASIGFFTASQKERTDHFEKGVQIVRDPDNELGDNYIKGLCKLLPVVIPRFGDGKSRKQALDLVQELLKRNRAVASQTLVQSLSDAYLSWRTIVPSSSVAKSAFQAFRWTALIVQGSDEEFMKSAHGEKLIELQSVLFCAIKGSDNERIGKALDKLLNHMWGKNESVTVTSSNVILKRIDQNIQMLIFSCAFIDWLGRSKQNKRIETLIKPTVDALVKLVVSNKQKCHHSHLKNLRPFLRHLSHDIFKQSLLPAMQKAMLRNPEVVLRAIAFIIADVNLDMSQYVPELKGPFATHLHAKDDGTRHDALEALAALAKQISDQAALEELLTKLFDVLGGSEGKLTINEQKCSLLNASGKLTSCAVSSASLQPVCVMAFKKYCEMLKTEVHEGTLIVALKNMEYWASKLTHEIPSDFIEWLPKGLTLKTSTLPVRCAYFSCLFASLKSSSLKSATSLVPTLLETVINAAKQPTQVLEASIASGCIVKLSALDEVESKLEEFWKVILDSSNALVVSERFLLSATPSALYALTTVAEKVILTKNDSCSDRSEWIRALIVALLCPVHYVRKNARSSLQRIVGGLGGDELAEAFLKELDSHMVNTAITLVSATPNDGEVTNNTVNVKYVIDALDTVVQGSKLSGIDEKSIRIAHHLLNPCHHPLVKSTYRNLWQKLLKKMKMDMRETVRGFKDILTEEIDGRLKQECITTLILHNPSFITPKILNLLNDCLLKNPELFVTAEEYAIYKTPRGEVFDKEFLETIQKNEDVKNVQRESKAYSYKEQMEELALRKEIEEKRRREGKAVAPKLTPKQKELLNAQLEKEENIRKKVEVLKERIDPILKMTKLAIESNPEAFRSKITLILSCLFSGFRSPASAEDCCQIFRLLRRGLFDPEDETIAQIIASTVIKIKDPCCQFPDPLGSSQLIESVRSVSKKIGEATIESMAADPSNVCPFRTSAFSYAFPVLDFASRKLFSDEEFVLEICAILDEHAQLRGTEEVEDDEVPDDYHPRYLPITDMLSSIIDLIGKTEGRSQQRAVATIVEIASAASGLTGCAKARFCDISVLLGALQSDVEALRDAGLRGLDAMIPALPEPGDEMHHKVARRIWVARFDVREEIAELASELWEKSGFLSDDLPSKEMRDDIMHPVACVRAAGAEALSNLIETRRSEIKEIVDVLLEDFDRKLEMTKPVIDHLGREVQKPIDHWEPRSGIAIALKKLVPFFDSDIVKKIADFVVPKALDDRNETVRQNVLDAAVAMVNMHGKETAEDILPVFEKFMEDSEKSAKHDNARQSVVILMGSMAKHLDSSDPKVRPIIRQLIIALKTPSQQVQEAVAQCLPPLVPAIKEEAPEIVNKLINTLLGANNSFGERKGAAYGIAGIVKGLGILSLKQLDIMGRLTTAIQDKKNPTHREGALFAFEMLCTMLGRLFEPYIVHILPHLLLCFGDNVAYVRQAADDTSRAVMSKLSAHGVKLVLPSLLNALEEDHWRTKAGSVELLGSMAFCAPKQLSSCLPSIVPKLIEVLSDSHSRVQSAGEQALKQIGSVIRNPEIQAIVPVLLKALQDPGKKTGPCLKTLLETKFVHFIDAPSLALIMPVVQRAFADRSTETRKMAAQIIGNMYSLTDQKDLSPYLPGIIPGLKNSLLDPVPEVRTVSAKALGAMVKGMGETSFDELLPWLMSTLTSESSSVDRSGAAQGLAEVVGGLGSEKMNDLMPDIIKTAERTDIAPHVKDGYIMMFIYMPTVFPDQFVPYIAQIISPVLRALADENEFVRDTAYKAGQRLVTTYAESAIALLLPELEKGMFDDNWRIRHSSVQLLGDLLYKISGVSGKMSTETAGEDDNFGTEQSQAVIIRVLGQERRNRVLAGLYMGRSDVALMVRQVSLHVWKVIVSNTPKTLREILPTLFNLLLGCLASSSYDKRQVAARTLGDLVKKLGERVLPEIIPILEKGLESSQPEKRQGVCVGLSEIMSSTSRDMVFTFVDSLVPTVRRALCDDLPEVREAAAKSFESLHNTVGSRALDDILPEMLKQLDNEEQHDNALDGLRQVMAIKSRAVLPYLIPQLISKPVNTKALASLAPVSGEALHRHLTRILPALLFAMSEAHQTQNEESVREHAEAVVLSINDEDSDVGVRTLLEELLSSCKSQDLSTKRAAVTLLHAFCANTKVDYTDHVARLIRSLILLFTESDQEVLQQAWNALAAVTKSLDVNQQMSHVSDVRQAVRFAMMDLKNKDTLPGFCLPKGIQPILPIFRESILNGAPELKEQAATGLREVIEVTSASALKPSVVHITGPLIRILGDRFSHGVKVAVLDTLASLLSKAKEMLKPFFPQLQTTFLKALNDSNRSVRLKAGVALSYLIGIHTRPDPIFNELHNGIKNSEDAAIRDTYLQAMRGCIEPAGGNMSGPVRKQVLALLHSFLNHPEDSSRIVGSGCLGAFVKWMPDEDFCKLMDDHLSQDDPSMDWTLRHGRSTALSVALKVAPEKIYPDKFSSKLENIIRNYLTADRVPVAENGVRCVCYLFMHCIASQQNLPKELIVPFCKTMNHNSNDVKQLMAVVSTKMAVESSTMLPEDLLRPLLPMLVNGTKEKNSALRSSSEFALVEVLRLRDGKDGQAKCLALLESGAKDALGDVISKVLQRVVNQPQGKEEVIDNTILV